MNILMITADDMGAETPGCCGNKTPDITPNIDRLASEGLRFEHAFVTVSVCQPSRSVWATGRYPHRNGTIGFNPGVPGVPTLGEQLRKAGYYTGILNKLHHTGPNTPETWDYTHDPTAHHGRDPQDYVDKFSDFLAGAEKSRKPFFMMINILDPHRAFSGSDLEARNFRPLPPDPSRKYDPSEVDVPGYLPDAEKVRLELSWYYNSAKRCDDSVGMIMRHLEKAGLAGNTVVVFLSDNGAALPFAKGSCYVQSNRTPMIIRWPGVTRPGSVDGTHFIKGPDMMPTLLDIAGAEQPEYMDGSSFLPVIKGSAQPGRDSAVTVFHRDQFHIYNMRAHHEKRYGYIFNFWADGKHRFVADNMEHILYEYAETTERGKKRLQQYSWRSPEELFDYEKDPWGWNNLADDEAYKEVLEAKRAKLIKWMDKYGDPLLPSFKLYLQGRIRELKNPT